MDRFHLTFIDQGHIGVALFMVMSGFIMMTMFHGREMEPFKFYLNRVLRIYPLMILVVMLSYFSTSDPRPTTVGIDYIMSLLPISKTSIGCNMVRSVVISGRSPSNSSSICFFRCC